MNGRHCWRAWAIRQRVIPRDQTDRAAVVGVEGRKEKADGARSTQVVSSRVDFPGAIGVLKIDYVRLLVRRGPCVRVVMQRGMDNVGDDAGKQDGRHGHHERRGTVPSVCHRLRPVPATFSQTMQRHDIPHCTDSPVRGATRRSSERLVPSAVLCVARRESSWPLGGRPDRPLSRRNLRSFFQRIFSAQLPRHAITYHHSPGSGVR